MATMATMATIARTAGLPLTIVTSPIGPLLPASHNATLEDAGGVSPKKSPEIPRPHCIPWRTLPREEIFTEVALGLVGEGEET